MNLRALTKFLPLLALLLAMPARSALIGTPYLPEVDARFNTLESGGGVSSASILDGTITASDVASSTGASSFYVKKYAQAIYDVAVDGGGTGAHLLGLALPPNAIIWRSALYINTRLASAGASTFAVSCETANNIFTATDIQFKAAGNLLEGAYFSAGASTVYKTIATTCQVAATIGTTALSAGKVTIFVEYYVAN